MPGQLNVTQSEMETIMYAQLRELWGTYGDLSEIWMDGGYLDYWEPELAKLLELQPQAVVFNGCATQVRHGNKVPPCVSANPVCWIGSESGLAPDPTWSTGVTSNASSPIWCPKTIDTTIQVVDTGCGFSCNGMGWKVHTSEHTPLLCGLLFLFLICTPRLSIGLCSHIKR